MRDMAARDLEGRGKGVVRHPAGMVAKAHLSPLRGIPDVLERCGVPSQPILEAAGITHEQLNDPEASAPFVVLDELLGTCVRKTKCTHFGLLLSEFTNLSSLGIIGRLARNADTVGAALKDLASYFALHDTGGSLHIANSAEFAVFGYGIQIPGIQNSDQAYDLAVGTIFNIMKELCGPTWRPERILLPRSRPPEVRPYRKMFAAPVRFGAMQAAVVFRSSWLSARIEDTDAVLYRLLKNEASFDLGAADPLFFMDVRRAIEASLESGRCSRGDVACFLKLHERTLGRRLQASGTTFQKMLDATRSEMAKRMLHDTSRAVADIGASLGFRDPAVFTRAFRRWTNMTPREFRNQVRPVS
jgi:AraC-like DNA-binding protein